jgi:hypothetical protein
MRIGAYILFSLLAFKIAGQTIKIDSLKKQVAITTGKAQVDCLNQLGWQFYYYWIHSDSSLKYARLAFQKASTVNYNSGSAESLIIQANIEGRLFRRPATMIKYSQQAIDLLQNENDKKNFSMAYYSMAIGQILKGDDLKAHEAAAKAEQIAMTANDKFSLGWAKQSQGFIYSKTGEYWKAFGKLIEAKEIGLDINDSLLTSMSLAFIGRSFNRVGDHQKALVYYHESYRYAIPFQMLWAHMDDMAYSYLQLKKYDSAIYYQKKQRENIDSVTTDTLVRKKMKDNAWAFSIAIQLGKKEYDEILKELLPVVDQQRRNKDMITLLQTLITLAKVYDAKGDHKKALQFGRELMTLAAMTNNKQALNEGNEVLASIFENLHQTDSAYYYFVKYTVVKDSMETVQFSGRTALYLAASEAENKIRLLTKDKEISEQQLALNKEELQKKTAFQFFLIISITILVLISFLIIRNMNLKRRNDRLLNQQVQSGLQQKTMELEMQALRAQMNPHFIFNCLSAIDNLIQTNQSDKATTYLARFAKLIRSVLDSSKNNRVTFQQDFETIRLYLEMEQFRCNNKFNYQLTADNELLHGDYKVPPLIVQPFVENAIHHGLLNKEDNNRQLQVQAQLKDEHIIYSITDNGIGRQKAAIIKQVNKPDQRSYGIAITKERIHLHNKNEVNGDVEIMDLENNGIATGTKAIIRINSFDM